MKKIIIFFLVLIAIFFAGCDDDPELEARFSAQNYQPHINAISLQRGERDDNYFDIVIRVGKRNRDPFILDDPDEPPPPPPPLNLVDIKRITFDIEYWGSIIQFVSNFEKGNFFEQQFPDQSIHYTVEELGIDEESGLNVLHIDVYVSEPPESPERLEYFYGDLLVLKFRANRSGNVPVNIAGRYGDAFNGSGEKISGVGWYGGFVDAFYE